MTAYQKAGYRIMDLIYLITTKRRELAGQIDLRATLTEAQEEAELTQIHGSDR